MKIGEALSILKKEQGRLARLIFLRKENVYIEKGKITNLKPKELSKEIKEKIELKNNLKSKL